MNELLFNSITSSLFQLSESFQAGLTLTTAP